MPRNKGSKQNIENALATSDAITRRALFGAFLAIGLSGFGGVLPWAHRALVEQKKWLSENEFAELLSLGQTVPGPNIVNMSIMIGARFHGVAGALLAFLGLMSAPFAIVLALGVLYERYGDIMLVRRAIGGVVAVAAGLVIAMAVKMAAAQPRKPGPLVICIAAFTMVGILRLPLIVTLAVLAPIGIAFAWKSKI